MVTFVSITRALDGIARKGLTVAVAACLAAAAVLAATAPASRQDGATGGPDGSTLARRYFEEVWNRGQVDVLDELLAPEYVNPTPSFGNPPPGPNGLKPIVLAMRRAFPDLHFTIEDVVVTPDAVAVRTTMTGTHTRGSLRDRSDISANQGDADPDRACARRPHRRTLACDR